MSRGMGNWISGNDGKRARALREAVDIHASARISESLSAPRKRDLYAELAEAARNTAARKIGEEA